jgi:carbon monoxide dehydrogenase subunit G
MATFTAHNRSEAVVPTGREEIWKVLTDPDLLAKLTPLLKSVTPDGDHWTWRLVKIPVLSTSIAPKFTERMHFTEMESITFTHEPPDATEKAGAEGRYDLTEVEGGTHLVIDLQLCVDLPLPRISAPAVTAVMSQVVVRMGDKFADNLYDHLGLPKP